MKNFDWWNQQKKHTEKNNKKVFVKERDIFFVKTGLNIGFEQDGKGNKFARPVLILKKFNNFIFWGIPLNTKPKEGKYYYNFSFLTDIKSCAILSQLRLFDTKRLLDKIGMIAQEDFLKIKEKTRNLI